MPFKPFLVPMNIMLTEESVNLPDKNNKCTWNMQKLNPSVDDIKITLYHYLWELKWCSTLLGFCSVSYEEENFFIPELSLFSFTPPYNFFVSFSSTSKQENPPIWNKAIRLLLIKLYYTTLSFRYICASYHSSFSFLSVYSICTPYKNLIPKVAWDIENFRIFCNFD